MSSQATTSAVVRSSAAATDATRVDFTLMDVRAFEGVHPVPDVILTGRTEATRLISGTGGSGALVSQLINWLMWVSLMASLGAVLYGAAMWRGGAKMGNTPRGEDGRNYVGGGAVGALLAGLAVVLINTLFEVGRAGG